MKRPRKNRVQERAGVNAARAFFESNHWLFQEIDRDNDYGRDAYIDVATATSVTATTGAVQIKSGKSFRTEDGRYRFPLKPDDALYWAASNIPIIGLVHDERANTLYWCNVTEALVATPWPKSVYLDARHQLTAASLGALADAIRASSDASRHPLLTSLSVDADLARQAIYDCFALARRDPQVLVVLRHLVSVISPAARRSAIGVLTHVAGNPDIFFTKTTWLPEATQAAARRAFADWSQSELAALLEVVGFDEVERGGIGQAVFHLISFDSNIEAKLLQCATRADDPAGSIALALGLYLASEDGPDRLQHLVTEHPQVRSLEWFGQVASGLREFGYVSLW
jgi:hypothetical protein